LRASGARPRRSQRSGVDALTASELRVARMAAAGASNRDIAQALFVSLRTVETHLTRAYDKLGVAARGGLAEALGAASEGP
jgi:DNA-binding CsgD family transcriptional regulator